MHGNRLTQCGRRSRVQQWSNYDPILVKDKTLSTNFPLRTTMHNGLLFFFNGLSILMHKVCQKS